MVNSDDDQLIRECLEGQTHVFGLLVSRYQDRLFNTLTSVLGSFHDARDVSQDAFIHAFEKLHTFRGQSTFYSWLFRIALNCAVSRQRKQSRGHASIEATREQTGLEPADHHPEAQPEFALESAERQRLVQAALAALPEEFRTVLILKEIEGYKYEEIAEIVDCPIGTVRSRIHRGRLELREKLQVLFNQQEN